jgi:hypothetical protein
MGGIRKNKEHATNTMVALRIYAEDPKKLGSERWHDMAELFKELANGYAQAKLDKMIDRHKLAMEIIDVL